MTDQLRCPKCAKFMTAGKPHDCGTIPKSTGAFPVCSDCHQPHLATNLCSKREDRKMGDLANHTCPSCEAWKARALASEELILRKREKERQRSASRQRKRSVTKNQPRRNDNAQDRDC